MNVNDCFLLNENDAVYLAYSHTYLIKYHDRANCSICSAGTHEEASAYYDGKYCLDYNIDALAGGPLDINAKGSEYYKEGTIVYAAISCDIAIQNNAVLSDQYSISCIQYSWQWVKEGEPENDKFKYDLETTNQSAVASQGYNDWILYHPNYTTDQLNEYLHGDHLRQHSVYAFHAAASDQDDSSGILTSYIINCPNASIDASRFSQLNDIVGKRVLTYSKNSSGSCYNLYLNDIGGDGDYVVVLEAAGEDLTSSSYDGDVFHGRNGPYLRYQRMQNPSSNSSEYTAFLAFSFPEGYEVEDSQFKVVNVLEKNYAEIALRPSSATTRMYELFLNEDKNEICLCSFSDASSQFASNPCKNNKFSYDSVTSTSNFAFSLDSDILFKTANIAGLAKTCSTQSLFASKAIEENQNYSYGSINYAFDVNKAVLQANMHFSSEDDILSSTSLFMKISPDDTPSAIQKKLQKVKINISNENVELAGFIGKFRHDDMHSNRLHISSGELTYSSNGIIDLTDMTTMENMAFIPCSVIGQKMKSNQAVSQAFSKTVEGWMTFYPVYVSKKDTLLINVFPAESHQRDIHAATVIKSMLAKSYAMKCIDENDQILAQDAQQLIDEIDSTDDYSQKSVLAGNFINLMNNQGCVIDVANVYNSSDLSAKMLNADQYNSTIVNMIVPAYRYRSRESSSYGRVYAVQKKSSTDSTNVGLAYTWKNFYSKLKTNLTFICPSSYASGVLLSPLFAPKTALGKNNATGSRSKYGCIGICGDVATSRSIYIGDEDNDTDKYLIYALIENACKAGQTTNKSLTTSIMNQMLAAKNIVIYGNKNGNGSLVKDILLRLCSMMVQIPSVIMNENSCIAENSRFMLVHASVNDMTSSIQAINDMITLYGSSYVLNDDIPPTVVFAFLYACTSPELLNQFISDVKKRVNNSFNNNWTRFSQLDSATNVFGSNVITSPHRACKEFVNTLINIFDSLNDGLNEQALASLMNSVCSKNNDPSSDEAFIYTYFYDYLFPVFFRYNKQKFDEIESLISRVSSQEANQVSDEDNRYFLANIGFSIVNKTELETPDSILIEFTSQYEEFAQNFNEYSQMLRNVVQCTISGIYEVWSNRNDIIDIIDKDHADDYSDYSIWEMIFTSLMSDYPHASLIKGSSDFQNEYALI